MLNSQFGEFIFIAGVITIAIAIILRKSKIFIAQAVVLMGSLLVPTLLENTLFSTLMVLIQLILIIFAIIQYKKAVDFNYQLILEKTHQIPRKITVGGNFGDEQ
jgi:hypothetical protein